MVRVPCVHRVQPSPECLTFSVPVFRNSILQISCQQDERDKNAMIQYGTNLKL